MEGGPDIYLGCEDVVVPFGDGRTRLPVCAKVERRWERVFGVRGTILRL